MRRSPLPAFVLPTLLIFAATLLPTAASAATPADLAAAAGDPTAAAGTGTGAAAGTGANQGAGATQGAATLRSVPVSISTPRHVTRDLLTAVRVSLPGSVAAVDGRVLVAKGSARLIGVALLGKGTGLRPVTIKGGAAFGAYGLRAVHGRTILDLVLLPKRSGRLQVRVVIDATSDRTGHRMSPLGADQLSTLGVAGSSRTFAAPSAGARLLAVRAASPASELLPDGRFNKRDLDAARAGWEAARLKGRVCRPAARADVNADGCSDIVDVQATLAAQGRYTGTGREAKAALRPRIAAAGSHTFTVTSTADTADALRGDGICADASSQCTLRAAIGEADYLQGDDRIVFSLPGTAPVTIQLGSRLPIIASRAGTLVIDGYSQPGSSVNTSAVGSNAVPGVELRGNGNSAREVGIYITSPGNTIRGLVLQNLYRGIVLDGVDAHDDRILGNWIGFRRDGTNVSQMSQYDILVNTGAHDNRIGTADPADKNVIGNATEGIDNYGPGTNGNIIQGNQLCIRPSGFGTATCSTAIDHNFGPKNDVIGGDGPGEKNVIGPTSLQAIEYSHGWNPALTWGTDTATTYQINGNTVTGNWVGFRGDGSYDPAYRSGQNQSSADNGNAINVYDGAYDNIVQRNYVGSVYDGIQTMAPDAQGNIFRGNIIGESPLGQAAPLNGWGVKVRWSTKHASITGNTIRNAVKGGIGLVNYSNSGAYQAPAYNIKISRNIVTDTNGPAIDLFGIAGADPNDSGDTDKGANTLLNTPVITFANTVIVRGTGLKKATVEVFRATLAAGSVGLPVEYLGKAVVAADGTWSVSVSTLNAGDRVTALQIKTDDTTSELSANVSVAQAPQSGDILAADAFERDLGGEWGTSDTGQAWKLTGTAADFSVGSGTGRLRPGRPGA